MSYRTIILAWSPVEKDIQYPIFPIFIPFQGCPSRCVFCAQQHQTGQTEQPLSQTLQAAETALRQRADNGLPPVEVAFYGGTFTALPARERQCCLDFYTHMHEQGLALSFRCSTRPDAVDVALLTELRRCGCRMVELGVQSFNTQSLQQSQRGYSGEEALKGCRAVLDAKLHLGIQLMPGMPGSSPQSFLQDVALALGSAPSLLSTSALRLYPCVVMEGTALAQRWRQGLFQPWDTALTLDLLTQAWLWAQQKQIPIIRMGVAPQQEFLQALLAGPWEASLGSRVMGKALLQTVEQQISKQEGRLQQLSVPRSCQGYFWGHKRELAPHWEQLGVRKDTLAWHNAPCLKLALR